jgi:hypothetical protein
MRAVVVSVEVRVIIGLGVQHHEFDCHGTGRYRRAPRLSRRPGAPPRRAGQT